MSTNFHIDDIGNLILRDGKLGLFVSSQYVTPPHYGGGRVGALCPYAYCAGDPVNLVDPDGKDLVDVLAGLGIGIRTNMPLGNGEDRDAYSPTDTDDYNKGLRIADAVSFAAGVTFMIAGAIETIGGALGTTVGAAAEVPSAGASTLVVVGSATVSADGVAKMGAGATVTMNAVSNGQQGYNRGADSTNGSQPKDVKSEKKGLSWKDINSDAAHGRLPKDLKRVDPSHTPDGQPHVHPKKGAAINKDGTLHDQHEGTPQISKNN